MDYWDHVHLCLVLSKQVVRIFTKHYYSIFVSNIFLFFRTVVPLLKLITDIPGWRRSSQMVCPLYMFPCGIIHFLDRKWYNWFLFFGDVTQWSRGGFLCAMRDSVDVTRSNCIFDNEQCKGT